MRCHIVKVYLFMELFQKLFSGILSVKISRIWIENPQGFPDNDLKYPISLRRAL